MKKLILGLVIIMFSCGISEAKTNKCIYIWDTTFQNATVDAPDDIYCSYDGEPYRSYGGTHIQSAEGHTSGSMAYDTVTPDGINTIGGLHADITDTQVICSNVTALADLNVHNVVATEPVKIDTLSYYYEVPDMADATIKGINMDWPDNFKLTVTESNSAAGCLVVYTTVTWN